MSIVHGKSFGLKALTQDSKREISLYRKLKNSPMEVAIPRKVYFKLWYQNSQRPVVISCMMLNLLFKRCFRSKCPEVENYE
ncbi:hypothetical protein CEXT_572431 [Caerostris extrusa]|uniref:Uncharacterized protein n=1 Tax=Caerostris extrusa TaxID=172846 RepID=A0AAV4QMS6_CAEEX|nr:hypothetical protein CEXT_572431 [Caerostris extrusa]